MAELRKFVTKPNHGSVIGIIENDVVTADAALQLYLDDITEKLNILLLGDSILMQNYTVATLPEVPAKNSGWIFVTDEVGGSVPAFSDGAVWRRCTDRAIVS